MDKKNSNEIIIQAFDIIEDLLNHLENYNYQNSPHEDTIHYNKREFNFLKQDYLKKGVKKNEISNM